MLILIVGCCGLASNLVGFVVLGHGGHDHGHGHSHDGHDHEHGDLDHSHGHVHDHNEAAAAEEGRARRGADTLEDDDGPVTDVFPEVAIAKATLHPSSPDTVRHVHVNESDRTERSASRSSAPRGRERRRAGSFKHGRLQSIDDYSFHPASFRQNIIEHSQHSRANVDDTGSSEDETAVDENTPLISNGENGHGNGNGHAHAHGNHKGHCGSRMGRSRRDSGIHEEHNHNKPRTHKSGGGGHSHNHADMGMHAMVLHVLGDALGNVGVIITALVIWLTDWSWKNYTDPAVSLFITAIILHTALPLTRASAQVLLQATPDEIDIQDIKEDIQALEGVVSCHHVHVWRLSDTKIVASMHVRVSFPITAEGGEKYMVLAKQARKCLHAYGIHSATIQPEFCTDSVRDQADQVTLQFDGANDGAAMCLLECTDDCVEQGCCTASQNGGGSVRSSHSAHSHS